MCELRTAHIDAWEAWQMNGKFIMFWDERWDRIGQLQRQGLLRVKPLNRLMAEVSFGG